MTGLKQRIFRRRAPGSPRRSAAGFLPRLKAGASRLRPSGRGARMPWGKKAARPAALPSGPDATTTAVETTEVVDVAPGSASFRDRGRLRRRLRFLRRARELAFRDVGGLIFDMRRFGRDRPDLVEAKLAALGAVDRELRALERVLDDRRPIHELREPGLSSCPRCGALHASEDNFCPRCGLQFGGAQAMGEVGGAIAAPPQAPPAPIAQPTAATLVAPGSGLEQAASQAGHAAAVARPGLFSDGAHRPTPADEPTRSADGVRSHPASPADEPEPSADGAHGHAAAPADEPEPLADAAHGHAASPADEPEPPAGDAAERPATRTPAVDEPQTEIFRPHDAS